MTLNDSPISDDNVCSGAGDNRLQLRLLRLRHPKLVQGLLEIIQESVPLGGGNQQMLVRIAHGATGILLLPACRLADHFGESNIEVMSSIDRCFVPIFG